MRFCTFLKAVLPPPRLILRLGKQMVLKRNVIMAGTPVRDGEAREGVTTEWGGGRGRS